MAYEGHEFNVHEHVDCYISIIIIMSVYPDTDLLDLPNRHAVTCVDADGVLF